jgi:hypothetical protein
MHEKRCSLLLVASSALMAFALPVRASQLTVSPASGSAGAIHVGSSGTVAFDMINTPGAIQVSGAGESGLHCSEFALTTPPSLPHVIPSGSTEIWVVTFTPMAANRGARGPCTYTFDDPDGNSDTFAASGTATQPNMVVSALSLDFGVVVLGGSKTDTTTVTVGNPSPSNETLEFVVSKSGAGAGAFTIAPACTSPCSVAVGSTQAFSITFTPSAAVSFSATMQISGDDAGNPSDSVTLTGTGVEPNVPALNGFGASMLALALVAAAVAVARRRARAGGAAGPARRSCRIVL